MTLVVPVNWRHEPNGEPIKLAPRRRRLSTIMRRHGPGNGRAFPLVFRKGQDWRTADRAELDQAARLRGQYCGTIVGPKDTVVIVRPPLGRTGGLIAITLATIALTVIAGPAGTAAGSAAATAFGLGAAGASMIGFAVQAGLLVGVSALALQIGTSP